MGSRLMVIAVAALAVLALAVLGGGQAHAQGLSEGLPGPHKDMIVRSVFPDFPDGKFPVGEAIDVLIAFRNQHPRNSFNVSSAAGQLVNPLDFSMSFFNFSSFQYNALLGPGDEGSIVYKFRSDPAMEPRDFGFKLNVVYFDHHQHPYLHLAANQTISFEENSTAFDFQSLFAFLLIGAILAVAGFLGYTMIFSGKKSGGDKGRGGGASSKAVKETGTRDNKEVDLQFLDPHLRQYASKGNKKGGAGLTKRTTSK